MSSNDNILFSRGIGFLTDKLVLYDFNNSKENIVFEGRIGDYYWSPDGRYIAICGLLCPAEGQKGRYIGIYPISYKDDEISVGECKLVYKLIEYLTEKFKKRTKKPLALAFTKNDIYGIKDPKKAFFEYTVPVFNLSQVFYYLKNYEFFAVSAFGGDLEQIRSEGRTATPIDIEKPFFWLLKQI